MSILIKGMEMPTFEHGVRTINVYADGVVTNYAEEQIGIAVSVPTWHRVEEPPKYTGRYVVWCGVNWYGEGMHDEFMTANYNTVSGRWSVDCDKTIRWPLIGDITYWMPIEPPKEEEHGN